MTNVKWQNYKEKTYRSKNKSISTFSEVYKTGHRLARLLWIVGRRLLNDPQSTSLNLCDNLLLKMVQFLPLMQVYGIFHP